MKSYFTPNLSCYRSGSRRPLFTFPMRVECYMQRWYLYLHRGVPRGPVLRMQTRMCVELRLPEGQSLHEEQMWRSMCWNLQR